MNCATTATLDLPTCQAQYWHEARLRLDPPSGPAAVRSEKLAHRIARGFAARDQLAALPDDRARHLGRIAKLAYLDPAIVRSILAGTHPSHISARSLWRMASLPLGWVEQRVALRFKQN